jgi:glycosyltransferase involved in cell wall biosynthesis
MIKLSIVTISFNQLGYLRECLNSVLSQKTHQVEFIVVDPGSTDGSREFLEAHRDCIDHLIFEPDKGPADGLNRGFAVATGTHGYFINSDDFLLPGAVSRLRNFWERNPTANLGLCEAWLVDRRSRPLRRLRPSRISPTRILDGRSVTVQQGISFSMDLFRKVGGFQNENRSSWDTELLYDFALSGARVAYGRERIGAFRLHSDSLTGGIAGNLHIEQLKQDREQMRKRLPLMAGRLLPRTLARIIKNLEDPFFVAENMRMRLFPNSVRSRWRQDTLALPPE